MCISLNDRAKNKQYRSFVWQKLLKTFEGNTSSIHCISTAISIQLFFSIIPNY